MRQKGQKIDHSVGQRFTDVSKNIKPYTTAEIMAHIDDQGHIEWVEAVVVSLFKRW